MYVAVKGGEAAINEAHKLLAEERRGDLAVPELSTAQIEEQLSLSVDRVMTEGSLYDRKLAALAIKQARGDLIEAIFLIRAYRTTLPRFGYSAAVDTAKMGIRRRISATFKDIPGGQVLGPTFDYTHRLLDFKLAAEEGDEGETSGSDFAELPDGVAQLDDSMPRVVDLLKHEGLIEEERPGEKPESIGDLTREPMNFPVDRDVRLQNLARGDEGFLLALGYSTQRGYGRSHPFAGEIRLGEVAVEFVPEDLGFPIEIGEVTLSECQMVNQFKGSTEAPPQFTRGYGLSFGHCERKVMAMALVDRALKGRELGEVVDSPAQDEEFVMEHSDNIQASGFVEHLKLPHYVDFQSELELVRKMRRERREADLGEKDPQAVEAAE
ncbi:carbon-phosphorus lyase complex subunit PhnI [Pelagibius sp. Alg239-R121]|uniref:carbon-phosphorus lyase complex subunit PhnI n=1 Tax=Pelagibius sp. Alg239-R121 TaxID=2993448 RepID=UPI0024A7375D|nr:carbon-phosphorus lyase complex subunit PhnI [Pelagibius sp. Alg239-R121]